MSTAAPSKSPLVEARDALVLAVRRGLLRYRQLEAKVQQRRFVGTYVAITGSCGKTTTTALTVALLAANGSVKRGGLNAGMDLLRTVRKLRAPVDFVVQETSGHEPGALDFTTKAYSIDVAVVTSVGHDHGGSFRFSDVDIPTAIAREKGKLVAAVRPGGIACLNADDPLVSAMAARTRERVVSFGRSEGAELRAINIEARLPGRLCFDLLIGGRNRPVKTCFVGTLMLTNVLGALSVVHGLGFDVDRAVEQLAEIEPVHNRMGVHVGKDGKTYILDTEKAPHWSTALLVDDLPNLGTRELTFVLGDMSDIQADSGKKYRRLLRLLCERCAQVVAAGRSANYVDLLHREGLANIVAAPTAFDVSRFLDDQPSGLVIIKSNTTLQLWRVPDQVSAVGEGDTHA